MKKTLLASALVLSAACSPQSPDHHLAIRPAPQLTPSAICSHTIDANRWPAGDLCDTLRGAPGFGKHYPLHDWSWDNRHIGWVRIRGTNCWDTTTTDQIYTICWDGRIKKV